MTDIPKDLDKKELRRFGLTTGGILAGLFGVFFPWLLDRATPIWPWVLGGILVVWALAAPSTLKLVYQGWMRFGLIMSRITTPIILTVLFFGVALPTGLVRRALGYDSMARTFDQEAESYRIPSHDISKQDLKRPF